MTATQTAKTQRTTDSEPVTRPEGSATRSLGGEGIVTPLPTAPRSAGRERSLRVAILAMKNLTWNTRIVRQAKALRETGHEVTVVCLVAPDASLREQAPGVEYIELDVRPVPERFRRIEQGVRSGTGVVRDALMLLLIELPVFLLGLPFRILAPVWRLFLRAGRSLRRAAGRLLHLGRLARIRLSVRVDMAARRGAKRLAQDYQRFRMAVRRNLGHLGFKLGRALRRAKISLKVWRRVLIKALRQMFRLARRVAIASFRTTLFLVGGLLEFVWRVVTLVLDLFVFLLRACWTVVRTGFQLAVDLLTPVFRMRLDLAGRLRRSFDSRGRKDRVPLAVRLRPYRSLLMQEQFRQLAGDALAGRQIDVVQGHDSHALRAAERIAENAGARLVYDAVEIPTDRSGWAASDIPRWVRRLEDGLNGQVIRRAGGIFTVSRGLAEWMRDNYRIGVPPLVRNCRLYEDFPKDDRIRWDCRLEPDQKLALYLNSLYGGQGLEQLIDATAHLPEHIHVATLGPMPQKSYIEDLRNRIARRGVEDRFHILEPKPPAEMLAYASGADIGVIPRQRTSLNNEISLPNRVFEMVMARLPIAAPSLPDMRRFVEEYEIGLWFDEKKPRDIARVIETMLEPETLERLHERVATAAQTLSWEHEGRHYVELIERSDALKPTGRWSMLQVAGSVGRALISR